LEKVQSVHHGHLHIAEDDASPEVVEGFRAVLRRQRGQALVFQQVQKRGTEAGVIIDYEQVRA
jgi:hypothetical protein